MNRRPFSPEAGFTLVELLVAVFVLLVGVLGVVALVDGANQTTSANRAREAATNLTRELIEDARSIAYGSLQPATLAATLAAQSGGTAQPNGTVVFERRGVTFTSTPSVCYVDDPKDGYGSHGGATFCNSNQDTRDGFAQDYKRFTVVTTWDGAKGSGTSRQSAVINDPGSAIAPQVTAFAMTAPTTCTGNPPCAQIDSGLSPTATFSVSTSTPAAKVTWYVNDMKMGTALGSASGPWTFTWSLAGVATGTYTVSVRANSGKDGAVRSMVVPVREPPTSSPTSPFGGMNQLWSNVAELNWTPVAATVLGYEVERLAGGSWQAVTCYDSKGSVAATPRPTGSYCMDKSAAGATKYRIFTVYSLSGTPTRSAPSPEVTIGTNVRPCPPGSLAVSTAGKVTWSAPTSAAGCDATRVKSYRVYRHLAASGGALPAGFAVTLDSRSFQTSSGSVTEWTDAAHQNNKTHYWVTAVDDFNAESTIVGPVR